MDSFNSSSAVMASCNSSALPPVCKLSGRPSYQTCNSSLSASTSSAQSLTTLAISSSLSCLERAGSTFCTEIRCSAKADLAVASTESNRLPSTMRVTLYLAISESHDLDGLCMAVITNEQCLA